jgi:hypothetical protein
MKKLLVLLCVLTANLAVALPLPRTTTGPSKHSLLAGREGGGGVQQRGCDGREGGGLRGTAGVEAF